MKSPTVADIVHHGIGQYRKQFGPLPAYQNKAVRDIMACRTPKLGGKRYQCDICGHRTMQYHSCRNRHCPQCQSYHNVQWINCRKSELLPVPYFHVVFTLPHQLNAFAIRNRTVFYQILLRAVKETLLELAQDPKRLGASIGLIALLHTWGQNLMDHPHVHCIVPGGGMEKQKSTWKSCSSTFLFPIAVIQKLYRGKFMAYITRAITAGEIQLHGSLQKYRDPAVYNRLINLLYNKKWVVHVKEPFASPEVVIKYLGQYTRRIAISNRRIIQVDNNRVTFVYKDYADGSKRKVMTISIVEFIRRFLLHILPKGFVRIRYYGFLANKNRKSKLTAIMQFFKRRIPVKRKYSVVELFKKLMNVDVSQCPVCKKGALNMFQIIDKEVMVT